MSAALLVVDLEGICLVERLVQIVAGTEAFRQAQRWLTAEVNHVVQAMQMAHGFDEIRISDSHLSGSGEPTVLASELVDGAELFMLDDAYDARLFDQVQAVACLGMHAGAGPDGFIPHTVNLHCAWSAHGRVVTEAELIMGLAAEAGAAVLFVSGDDVLERQLGDPTGFVRTKIAQSPVQARCVPKPHAWRALAHGAGRALETPVPNPARELDLEFHSGWQADLAEAAGTRRTGERTVRVAGESFRQLYERAAHAANVPDALVGEALRGHPGDRSFYDDVRALLLRRSMDAPAVAPSQSRLTRIFQSFWTQTESGSEPHRALRALVLHMLAHHAPRVFADLDLGSRLAEVIDDLAEVPAALEAALPFDLAQARVDACFVRSERGVEGPALDASELEDLLRHLATCGDEIEAFILGEMAALIGVEARIPLAGRPYRGTDRTEDLYWLTHLFLMASRYLATPVRREQLGHHIEELLLAVPWVIQTQQVDLAAEIALCLQLVGEQKAAEHRALLALIDEHTDENGLTRDPSAGDAWREMADHATGAALLALAWRVGTVGFFGTNRNATIRTQV